MVQTCGQPHDCLQTRCSPTIYGAQQMGAGPWVRN